MKCENQRFDRLVFDTVEWKNNGEEREKSTCLYQLLAAPQESSLEKKQGSRNGTETLQNNFNNSFIFNF